MIPKLGSKGRGILFGRDVDASGELVEAVDEESERFEKAESRSVRENAKKKSVCGE